jgi:hypothetical protein
MVRSVGENTFQPKIGFKTRYGMIHNPYANSGAAQAAVNGGLVDDNGIQLGVNRYYRRVLVKNLM